MMPLVGFLPATDERIVGTVEAIERELMRDGFVLRYPPDDRPTTACRRARARSCRARSGSPTTSSLLGPHGRGASLFERLLALAQRRRPARRGVRPGGRAPVGNFPQAFTHVGLVNTALHLGAAMR